MKVFGLVPWNVMVEGSAFAEPAVTDDGEIIPREVEAKTASNVRIMVAETDPMPPMGCRR